MPDRLLSSVQRRKSRGPILVGPFPWQHKKYSDQLHTPAAKGVPEKAGIPMRGNLWAEGETHDNGAEKAEENSKTCQRTIQETHLGGGVNDVREQGVHVRHLQSRHCGRGRSLRRKNKQMGSLYTEPFSVGSPRPARSEPEQALQQPRTRGPAGTVARGCRRRVWTKRHGPPTACAGEHLDPKVAEANPRTSVA
jgi:hypothetical protein